MDNTKEIKVILADEQDLVVEAYRSLFAREKSMRLVGHARNGRDAVQQCKLHQPHVLVMDIALPLLDGIATTRMVKAGQPSIKILVVTADESDELLFAALAAGADGYCLKTTPLRQIALAITAVNYGAAWLDRKVAAVVFREANRCRTETDYQRHFGLSVRQMQVLKLVMDGRSNQQIAESLNISVETVKSHVRIIMDKLAVSDRTQAAVQAFRAGLR